MAKKPKEKDEESAPKGSSLLSTLVVFVILTLLGAGAGYGTSTFLLPKPVPTQAVAIPAASDDEDASKDDDAAKSASQSVQVQNLETILTNISAPNDVWVRIELAVTSADSLPAALVEAVHQDLFAFVRTLKLQHIQGPSGYHSLKSELTLRARQRSQGQIDRVLVRTFLFE